MKSVITLLFFSLFFIARTKAQKVEKYCEVVLYEKVFGVEKVNPKIQFGQIDSLFSFKNPSVMENLKKVNSLNTRVDVLNYMSSLGWSPVNNTGSGNASVSLYIFRRNFDVSELNTP